MDPAKTYTVERSGGIAESMKRALVYAEVLVDTREQPVVSVYIRLLGDGQVEYDVVTAIEEEAA